MECGPLQRRTWQRGFAFPAEHPEGVARVQQQLAWQWSRNPHTRDAVRALLRRFPLGDGQRVVAQVGRAAVPVLLVWGTHDALVPVSCAAEFQRLIPGAELVLYERTGHNLFFEQEERLAQDLIDFITRRALAVRADSGGGLDAARAV
jgi:pimeloyl-ACP methyl ester carboxylesterase